MTTALNIFRAIWWVLRWTWKGCEAVAMSFACLLLVCLGPPGWLLLAWMIHSDHRERRHKEVLEAIRGRQ